MKNMDALDEMEKIGQNRTKWTKSDEMDQMDIIGQNWTKLDKMEQQRRNRTKLIEMDKYSKLTP